MAMMMSIIRSVGLLVLMVLLSSCGVFHTHPQVYSTMDADGSMQATHPGGGDKFTHFLSEGYARLARQSEFERDFHSVEQFRLRSLRTGSGGLIEPEDVSARRIPSFAVGEMTDARRWLMDALSNGSADVYPWESAQAQVMFDCWMEQQEENFQQADIDECRHGFYAAMRIIHRTEQVDHGLCALPPEPAPISEPAPVQVCQQQESFVLLFDHNTTRLASASVQEFERLVQAIGQHSPKKLLMRGHADLSGKQGYNRDLSKRRLEVVIAMLAQRGINNIPMDGDYFGETKPTVPTSDGIRELANRRVEVFLQ